MIEWQNNRRWHSREIGDKSETKAIYSRGGDSCPFIVIIGRWLQGDAEARRTNVTARHGRRDDRRRPWRNAMKVITRTYCWPPTCQLEPVFEVVLAESRSLHSVVVVALQAWRQVVVVVAAAAAEAVRPEAVDRTTVLRPDIAAAAAAEAEAGKQEEEEEEVEVAAVRWRRSPSTPRRSLSCCTQQDYANNNQPTQYSVDVLIVVLSINQSVIKNIYVRSKIASSQPSLPHKIRH